MIRWTWAALALAGCAREIKPPEPPKKPVREQVEFDLWPKQGEPVAGFDILEQEPELGKIAVDDTEYSAARKVVLRTLRWRPDGAPITVVCGVGEKIHEALLDVLESKGLALKREPGPLVRVSAADPKALSAFCRANVFIVWIQPAAKIDPAPFLAEWDRRIQARPPFEKKFEPVIREVRPTPPLDAVRSSARARFSLKVEGESGFVAAGVHVAETGFSQPYRLHTDALHLGLWIHAPGTYTVTLWVANRLQLAATSVQKFTVN